MRCGWMAGAVGLIAVVCGGSVVCAQDEGERRDFHAERAALVASVVPENPNVEGAWENLASALRAMALSEHRIGEALRVRNGLDPETPLDVDPLLLIDDEAESEKPEEERGERPAPEEADDAPAPPGEEDEGEAEDGEGGPPDLEAIARQGARTLMKTYESNRVYQRLTRLRLQPNLYIPVSDRRPLMLRDFSYAGGVRAIARLEAVRMWRALEAGEGEDAADSLEGLVVLAVVLSREPTLAGRLQSITVLGIVGETLKRWILEHGLEAETAREMLARMDRHLDDLTPLSYTFEGERLTGLDTIARVFSREIAAPMVMPEGEAGALRSREENEARLNELYDALIAWARAPVHERKGMEPTPSALAEGMPRGLVLVKLLGPGLEESVWMAEASRVEVDGLRLMLALEARRGEEGTYPESLAALVPSVLEEPVRDGYAPDGKYRYEAAAPEGEGASEAYVLYSVGYDGADDGGQPVEGGPSAAALRPGEAGVGADYVINALSGG